MNFPIFVEISGGHFHFGRRFMMATILDHRNALAPPSEIYT